AETEPEGADRRRLGVAAAALRMDGRKVALNDPALGRGWHGLEGVCRGAWRWTDGDARLHRAGIRRIEVTVRPMLLHWVPPDHAGAGPDPMDPSGRTLR
ncbi:MAG: hypothetical protein KGJ41_14730, partial [Rhodospirillales bacterium]|nr:hypothetical protein [Rhodospirillales bacterium]